MFCKKKSYLFVFLPFLHYFCPVLTLMFCSYTGQRVGIHIYGMAFTWHLVLWLYKNFATSKSSQEHGNGRCPVSMFYVRPCYIRMVTSGRGWDIYISAWAFVLLVRTGLGNAKAFVERSEWLVQTPTLFCIYGPESNFENMPLGSWGTYYIGYELFFFTNMDVSHIFLKK